MLQQMLHITPVFIRVSREMLQCYTIFYKNIFFKNILYLFFIV